VIAPAKTGKVVNNNTAVTNIAQTNKGNLCKYIPLDLIFKIVVIKLRDPKIEAAPAKCKEKIPQSTAAPGCDKAFDNGG
jgi:hypothetical protein